MDFGHFHRLERVLCLGAIAAVWMFASVLAPVVTNRSITIHVRAPGEIVELGRFGAGDKKLAGRKDSTVAVGDRVQQGQFLAAVSVKPGLRRNGVWIDPVVELQEYEQALTRLQAQADADPTAVRNSKRQIDADTIMAERVARTLRSWRIDEPRNGDQALNSLRRVEVRAPLAGIISRRNVAVGDIVDTKTPLFTIIADDP
jgi:biotin carboxyl carrier protein